MRLSPPVAYAEILRIQGGMAGLTVFVQHVRRSAEAVQVHPLEVNVDQLAQGGGLLQPGMRGQFTGRLGCEDIRATILPSTAVICGRFKPRFCSLSSKPHSCITDSGACSTPTPHERTNSIVSRSTSWKRSAAVRTAGVAGAAAA